MSDSSEPPAWSVGSTLRDRYRIDKIIGHGGMGEVLLAYDTLLDRRVALKRALSQHSDDPQRRNLILREARGVSAVNDRRIAAIHDVLEIGDDVVLVMEYVDGVTLRERTADRLDLEEFWDLAIQCVEALVVAHRHGIVHRDIKPDNLMVTDNGQVKILDFGLAKRVDPTDASTSAAPTKSTHVGGTPAYMAPEVHRGQDADARSDMFALGVVFYELLTGVQPFQGATYAAVAEQTMNATPRPVHERNPDVPLELSHVVERMLAKNPEDRFANADELLEQLLVTRRETAPDVPDDLDPLPGSRGVGRTGSTTMERPRRRGALVFALVAIVAVAIFGLLSLRAGGDRPLPAAINLAVVPPTVEAAESDARWFSLGTTQVLHDLLRRHTLTAGFQMAAFDETLDEDVTNAEQAHMLLGCNLVLRPAFTFEADTYEAQLTLLQDPGERVVRQRHVVRPATDLHGFLDALYRTTANMLALVPLEADPRQMLGIRGAGTLRFHLEGLGRLARGESAADIQAAIDEFELGGRTEPECAVLRAALSEAQRQMYFETRDEEWLARAETSAREAVALENRAESQSSLAFALSTSKQYAKAAAAFEQAHTFDPTDNRVNYQMGRNYNRIGQPERAREVYEAAIQSRPHCWQPYWWLATWHYRQGDVPGAIAAYRDMIERSPDLYKGYTSLGGLLVLEGDYEGAIEALERSVRLRPTRNAFSNLGTAHFNRRDFQSAIDAYNQAFQFGFADYELWMNLGDAYHWLKDRADQADDAYAQAVRLAQEERARRSRQGNTYDVMIAAHLASAFPRLQHTDSARVYLHEALDAGRSNPMVQYNAALAYWQLAQPDSALDWLEKSVAGGYPPVWLRDSAVFDSWRTSQRFRRIAQEPSGDTP